MLFREGITEGRGSPTLLVLSSWNLISYPTSASSGTPCPIHSREGPGEVLFPALKKLLPAYTQHPSTLLFPELRGPASCPAPPQGVCPQPGAGYIPGINGASPGDTHTPREAAAWEGQGHGGGARPPFPLSPGFTDTPGRGTKRKRFGKEVP